MDSLVDAILAGDASEVKRLVKEKLEELAREKIEFLKEAVVEEIYNDLDYELEVLEEKANRNVVKSGRTKLIRVRVRKGKVQRRKRFSAVKGYTIRGGRMMRMSSMEKRHRKIGARKGKIKRRGKLRQALRKRKVSLRKRRSMGL